MHKRTNYILGYGICVSDITNYTIEKLAELIHLAPQFEREVYLELLEEAMSPYKISGRHSKMSLTTILQTVIKECENIDLVIAERDDDEDGTSEYYLLYPPTFPWEQTKKITVEKLTTIFDKYTAILSNDKVEAQFYDYGSTT